MRFNKLYQTDFLEIRCACPTLFDALEDFDHISPASFEHINRLGKYNFKDEIKLEGNGLRALRKPKSGFGFKKN